MTTSRATMASTFSKKSSVEGDRQPCQWRLFVSRTSRTSSHPAWLQKKNDHERLDVSDTVTEDSSCRGSIVDENNEPEIPGSSSNHPPRPLNDDDTTATTKKKKKLQFHKRVLVKPTIHLCNYTDEEIESAWHNYEDIQRFQNEARLEKRCRSGAT
jgi:hypothetical protein